MNKYVIAVDFGYPLNHRQRSSISDLAELTFKTWGDRPDTVILAQDFIYDKLSHHGFPRDRLIEVGTGQSNTAGLQSGGSYHMLKEAHAIICRLESDTCRSQQPQSHPSNASPPIQATVVAHALHVKRVVRQGQLLGLSLTPADNLPTRLYSSAAQWWCRNTFAWHLREAIGFIPLRLAGQI